MNFVFPLECKSHVAKLPELLEDHRLVFRRNADARILDGHFDKAGQCPAIDRDRAAVGRIFYRVVDHISQGLHDARRIDIDPLFVPLEVLDIHRQFSVAYRCFDFETQRLHHLRRSASAGSSTGAD